MSGEPKEQSGDNQEINEANAQAAQEERVPLKRRRTKTKAKTADYLGEEMEARRKIEEQELKSAAEEVEQVEKDNAVLDLLPEKTSLPGGKITRRNILRGALLGMSAVLGGKMLYDMAKKEKPAAAEIAEKTGIDLSKIAERHNFSAELQVENGDGPYVIHIGQKHEHPTDKITGILLEGNVMRIQENIEGIIEDILETKKTSNKVFCEGFDENVVSQLKGLKKLREKTTVLKNAEDFNWLADQVCLETNDVFTYIYSQRLEEMAEHFQKNPPEFDPNSIDEALARETGVKGATEREKFARGMAMVEERKNGKASKKLKDRIYIKGAQTKMFLDGKIDILAAEDPDTHKKAMEIVRRLQGLLEEDKQGSLEERAKKDPEKVKKEMEAIEREDAEIVQRGREDAALKIITSRTDVGRLPLLIYGKKHNFTEAVEAHNKANPGKKMGLVRLNPIREQN